MKRLIDGNALASLFRTRRALEGNPNAQDAFEVAMWDATQAEEISLNSLRDEVYEDAVKHGLWELPEERAKISCDKMGHGADGAWGANFLRSECASLVWDEAIELDRAYKSKDGFTEELADVIIMSLSVAGKLGIDIDAAVKRKMAINKERPWKHEGEKK